MTGRYLCPHCEGWIGGWERACPHCGEPITPIEPPPGAQRQGDSVLHQLLSLALVIWAVGYPALSCSPLFVGANAADAPGAAVGGLAAIVVGATLFPFWIVGLIVLVILRWVIK